MKKLTLRNQSAFFSQMLVGEEFDYAFSSFSFPCVVEVAMRAGFKVVYLAGTHCKISEKII